MTAINSILELNGLVKDSDNLLKKDIVNSEELKVFKRKCAISYRKIINLNYNNISIELAQQGLRYEIKRIKNPIYRWLYNFITEARNNITFDAPYLKKRTDSDYNKTYIFWTRQRLIGIIKQLEKE